MDKLAKTEKTEKVKEVDPFVIMDRLDDEAFLEEMKGRVVDTWAYSFFQDGKEVTGLSKVGVDQACREMAKGGEVIREEKVEYAVDPTDKRFMLFVGTACRLAVSKDGKEVCLDRTIGTKRQCIYIVTKDGITDRVNPFWFEQGAMKALRNARMRLLSEEIKTKVIGIAKELRKTKLVKNGNGSAVNVSKADNNKNPSNQTSKNNTDTPYDEPRYFSEEEIYDEPYEEKRFSKDILREKLLDYCEMENGKINKDLLSDVVQAIAKKKDGTPIMSWDSLEKVDAEKYEKWFAKILNEFEKKYGGNDADSTL